MFVDLDAGKFRKLRCDENSVPGQVDQRPSSSGVRGASEAARKFFSKKIPITKWILLLIRCLGKNELVGIYILFIEKNFFFFLTYMMTTTKLHLDNDNQHRFLKKLIHA